MNRILKLSLEQMALIKVAIALWTKDEINNVAKLTKLWKTDEKEKYWQMIEDRVLEKVKQLSQPEGFKEKISSLVRPIGLEIMQWIDKNEDWCNNGSRVLKAEKDETLVSFELFWTPQGTVNKRKTAEMLIKDETFDIEKRYILACNYCLEKDVAELWNAMPEPYKQHFYSNEGPKNVSQPYLIVYWTYTIKGEVDRMNERTWNNYSKYKCAFINAVDSDNLEAAKFFFTKLTANERNKTLMKVAANQVNGQLITCSSDMWCFLLSQMDKDQETQKLQNYSIIIRSFLKWPWQSLFMEIAKRVILFEVGSYSIIREIIVLAKQGYRDYDYQTLIREYWQYIPKKHKREFIRQINNYDVECLLKLLEIKDMDNFYLILQEATAKECLQIFCHEKHHSFYHFSPPLLEHIRRSSSSRHFDQFVEEFKVRILCCRSEDVIEKEKDTWNWLFRKLDYYVLRYNEIGRSCCYRKLFCEKIISGIKFDREMVEL